MLTSRIPVRHLALCAIAVASPVLAGPVAIYTNIDGHPTAQVPGLPGEQFRAPLVPFLSLYGSPNGAYWIFKAFTDNSDRDVIIVGSGTTGTTVAAEGEPSPLAGLDYGFMDSDCGVNNAGRYIFGDRLAGGSTTDDEILFRFDGTNLVTAAREGDAAPGLFDPGVAGDELFGNSLNSAHLLNDDTPAFKADLIQNIPTDFESALYHGATVVAQEGAAIETIAGGDVYDSFTGTSGDTFSSSTDGSKWIVEADVAAGITTVEGVVVNGSVVVRDGDDLGLGALVDAVFAVDMGGNGDWLARGDLVGDDDWVLRNGAVVAATGQPITPGNTELYAASILSIHSNALGDWVVAADTSDGRQVVVRNGVEVIASTGDQVDLGLGPSSVAYIDSFNANDVFLSDLGELYAFVSLRDDLFQDIGDAFVVYPVANPCPWDCEAAPDGAVGINDFLALLAQWGQVGSSCDVDGGGTGINDFLDLLAHWGACP